MKLKLNFVIVIFVVVFCMIYFSNQHFCLIEDKEFNDADYWLLFGQNQQIDNGYLILEVNDTCGCWSYSKAQKGIMPHGWTCKDSLEKEVEFRRNIEANDGYMFLRIVANRSKFEFYDDSDSWVNFGVALWFKLNDDYDDPDSTQLVVDIRPISMKNNEFITCDMHFKGSHVDNDYHYLVTSQQFMSEANKTYDITVDVGNVVKRAFETFNIEKATLKNIDIYIEANYGYGKAWVDYIDLYVSPKPESSYVIFNSFIYGFVTFFVLILLSVLLKR